MRESFRFSAQAIVALAALVVAHHVLPAPVGAAPDLGPAPRAADAAASSVTGTAGRFAPGATARRVSGPARVVDGDTIHVASHRIRLEGIDAPEKAQACPAGGGRTWSCGEAAASHLADLIAGRDVTCRVLETDGYGRLIALCRAGATELNRDMVESGYAWAFVKYSRRFVAEEARAKAAREGVWRVAGAQPAWEFRARRWAAAETGTPSGCAIKGNITRNGRIYHMPWSGWYHRTRIDPARGERWFCSEAEARDAGWRPAHPG